MSRSVMPFGRNAPKLCPAVPVSVMSIVSSGSPAPLVALVTTWPSIVPTVRSTLRIVVASLTGVPCSIAWRASSMSFTSRASPRPWSCVVVECSGEELSTLARIGDRSRPEAQQGQVLADLLGDELEEVHDEVGLPIELLAKGRVLGGDADRAGVKVADPHHDAAFDDQRRGRETELLRAQQRSDDDVATGLQLAVRLDDDAVT